MLPHVCQERNHVSAITGTAMLNLGRMTLQVATRKFCPCGESPWLENWLGKCRLFQKRVLAIVATVVFGAVVFSYRGLVW